MKAILFPTDEGAANYKLALSKEDIKVLLGRKKVESFFLVLDTAVIKKKFFVTLFDKEAVTNLKFLLPKQGFSQRENELFFKESDGSLQLYIVRDKLVEVQRNGSVEIRIVRTGEQTRLISVYEETSEDGVLIADAYDNAIEVI